MVLGYKTALVMMLCHGPSSKDAVIPELALAIRKSSLVGMRIPHKCLWCDDKDRRREEATFSVTDESVGTKQVSCLTAARPCGIVRRAKYVEVTRADERKDGLASTGRIYV